MNIMAPELLFLLKIWYDYLIVITVHISTMGRIFYMSEGPSDIYHLISHSLSDFIWHLVDFKNVNQMTSYQMTSYQMTSYQRTVIITPRKLWPFIYSYLYIFCWNPVRLRNDRRKLSNYITILMYMLKPNIYSLTNFQHTYI